MKILMCSLTNQSWSLKGSKLRLRLLFVIPKRKSNPVLAFYYPVKTEIWCPDNQVTNLETFLK